MDLTLFEDQNLYCCYSRNDAAAQRKAENKILFKVLLKEHLSMVYGSRRVVASSRETGFDLELYQRSKNAERVTVAASDAGGMYEDNRRGS